MKCNDKKARDEQENFVRENFLKMCSLLISAISLPFPSLTFQTFFFFFFLTTIHFFSHQQAVYQLIKFNPLFISCFSLYWITAGKPNILSAKESTNRQKIIFPLKCWLLTLLSTWHPYFCEGKQQNLCMNIYTEFLWFWSALSKQQIHPPPRSVALLTAHYTLVLL